MESQGPQPGPPPAPPARGRLQSLALTTATSLVAVAAVAGIYLAVRPEPPAPDPAVAEEPAGAGLLQGHDYRVLVAVARLRPAKPDGDAWDSGPRSKAAPDPFYEIWWRGNRVYKSQEVDNVLVASWSNVALPELYKLIADDRISLETIKEGALITARRGGALRIRVLDDDPFDNDLIEELEVGIDDLRVGDQEIAGRQGLESLVVRVIPRDSRQLSSLIR